jgi:hypothetical protein
LPLSTIAQGADDDLAKQIQDLTNRINPDFNSAFDTKRDDLIAALECAFPKEKPISPTNKVACQKLAIELHFKRILESGANDDAKKKLQDEALTDLLKSKELVQSDVRKLFTAALEICKGTTDEQVTCQRKALEALFKQILDLASTDDAKKKLQDDTLEFLLKSEVLVDSEDKKALLAALGPTPARIHIVAAYYGHLDDIAYDLKYFRLEPKPKQLPDTPIGPGFFNDLSQHSYISDRFCVATRAVRALCQGQKFCFDAVPVPFTGTTLCGFEPAPYAEPRMKGLIIRYRCDSKKDWRPESDIVEDDEDAIPSGPDPKTTLNDNPIKSSKDAAIGVPQWALLRPGETTKIICTLPAAPAPAKTAAQ